MIPKHELRILEAHIRKIKLSQLDFIDPRELNEYESRELQELIELRAKGFPLQYLINNQEFYGREFYVNPSVLIPRPETEGLVELLLQSLPLTKSNQKLNILDFGTGSGCIGITVALERPDCRVWGAEASEEAYSVALENARKHRTINYEVIQVSDPPLLWQYDALPELDVLISNPPYLLKSDDISEEVRNSEPPEALFVPDQEEPAFYYHFLAELAFHKLNEQGFGIFEIAEHRAKEVSNAFDLKGFEFEVFNDLTQRPRYILIYRKGSRPVTSLEEKWKSL